jgi:hypothetical protein
LKEPVAGPEAGEKGVAGEKGTEEVFRSLGGRCFGKKNPQFAPAIGRLGRFNGGFHSARAKLSEPLYQDFFWRRFIGGWAFCLSGVFENQDATVIQMDFGCLPCLALVEPVWVRFIGLP